MIEQRRIQASEAAPDEDTREVLRQLIKERIRQHKAEDRWRGTESIPEEDWHLGDAADPSACRRSGRQSPETVLLTGASGFFGAFLLSELLAQSKARICCLVRAPNDGEAYRRIRDNLSWHSVWNESAASRIVAVAGDLSQPGLGMDGLRYRDLAASIDLVLHAGFLTNFLFSYDEVRAVNVGGTREILRFATTEQLKRLSFVSSFSVFLGADRGGFSAREHDLPRHCVGPYAGSKSVCEHLLRQAQERGVPLVVHRPPFIGWHTGSGAFNRHDFFVRLIATCLQLGAAPELDLSYFGVPAEFAAASVVRLSLDPAARGRTYHIIAEPEGIDWRAMIELFRREGLALDTTAYSEWITTARSLGQRNPLRGLMAILPPELSRSGRTLLDVLSRDACLGTFDNANLRSHISGPLPAMDQRWVASFLKRLRRDAPALY